MEVYALEIPRPCVIARSVATNQSPLREGIARLHLQQVQVSPPPPESGEGEGSS